MKRRHAVKIILSSSLLSQSIFSCKPEYKRPSGEHNLGEVSDLLYAQQIVRDRDILVLRDMQGWASMSTLCTYDGCALSYQNERFLCLCCNSEFRNDGRIIEGPATKSLPFLKMRYADGNLYANSGEIVPSIERYTTPEIEAAIKRLSDRIRKEGARSGVRIPEILLGKGDQTEMGPMFQEKEMKPPPPGTDLEDTNLEGEPDE